MFQCFFIFNNIKRRKLDKYNNKNRFFYRTDYKEYFEGIEFDAAFIGAGAMGNAPDDVTEDIKND